MSIRHRRALLVSVLQAILLAGCEPTCEERVVQEVLSPDQLYKATVYSSLCGFNIAANTQVAILPVAGKVGEASNVFAANASGAEAAHGPHGGPLTSVRWSGNRTLEITYDTMGSVVLHDERFQDFKVFYRVLPVSATTQVPPPPNVEASSYPR